MIVQFQADSVIRRPVEDVYRYVTDPANDPSWDPDVASIRLLTPPPISVGSRIEYGFRFMGRDSVSVGEVVELDAPRGEVIQFAAGMLGAAPRITYRFEASDEGTRFTRAARAEVHGLAATLAAPVLKRMLSAKNVSYVENVKRLLEGEGI